MKTETKYGTTYRYPESTDELAGRIISYDYMADYLKWESVHYQIYGVRRGKGGYILYGSIMDTYDDLIVDDFANMEGEPFAFIPDENMPDLLNLKYATGKRYYPCHPLPQTDTSWQLYYGSVQEFIALYEKD